MKRIALLFFFASLFIYPSYGKIIYVSTTGNNSNGLSWINAYTSLQTALSAAASSDQIWVAKGTYKPTDGTDRGISFTMKNDVAIYGGFAGSETLLSERNISVNKTILSGDIGTIGNSTDNSYHVINNSSINGTAILDGFIITGGKASGTDPHCNGAGMYNTSSSPTIYNCIFSENAANTNGGGMYNSSSSSPGIVNSTFISNSASEGGGMYNNSSSSPVLTNCIFNSNNASNGGGLYNKDFSSPYVTNCTFSHNSVSNDIPGISNWTASVTMKNSIIWDVRIPDHGYTLEIGGGNPGSVSFSCILDGDVGYNFNNNIWSDPQFVDADGVDNIFGTSDDNLRLRSSSPCVNTGTTSGTPSYDFLGLNRAGTPDMGAIENQNRNVFYVKADALGNNTGINWNNAYTSLQTALSVTVSGDTIWVAKGTYKPTTGTDRSISFQLKNGVTVLGGFAGTETSVNQRNNFGAGQVNETILSGDIGTIGNSSDNSYHVIYLPSGLGLTSTTVLDGFTITGGYANGGDPHNRGGGIYSVDNNFSLANCVVKDNTASWDCGGIYLNNSSPVITNCSIINNIGAYGGGIYAGNCTPIVRNCLISNNTINNSTGRGAGIALFGSNMLIENCIISYNSTPDDGGGMHIDHSSPTVKNCLINNNSSKHGGGVNLIWAETNPVFYNCTFTNNHTSWEDGGGAVKAVEGADGNFFNCILWGNYFDGTSAENEVYLHGGSVISLNYSCYYNSIGAFDGGSFNASNHNTTLDPLFVDTASRDFHLSSGSPCISTGLNPGGNSVPTTDIDGRSRPMGSGTDMGAYECDDNAALPIELISFTASSFDKGVEIKWQTATEINNYGFDIEKSLVIDHQSLTKWEKIGFVKGSGNSNSPKDYKFVDANPVQGNAEYRLKQIDTDGKFTYYSNIAEVNYAVTDVKDKQIPVEFGLSQNYPNPFNPTTKISFSIPDQSPFSKGGAGGFVTLKVYDILGNEVATLVNEHKAPGYYEVEFSAGSGGNAGSLATGVYIYRLTAGIFTSAKKLMLMK